MTEAIVVMAAKDMARSGFAMLIGASITSGGIGKNEDSAKLRPPRYQGARGSRAQRIAFVYSEEKSFTQAIPPSSGTKLTRSSISCS